MGCAKAQQRGSDELRIRTMQASDAEAVARLADVLVGDAYWPESLVLQTLERSTVAAGVFSYVAETAADELVAFRFVLPPGRWEQGRGKGLTPSAWPHPRAETAYFQSCFVAHSQMGRGLGGRLAHRALDELTAAGARAVVAHSWKESPHGSSLRYLTRLGFVPVDEHPRYWADVDYTCSRCGGPCECTAIEVVLDLTTRVPPPEREARP